MKRMTALRSAAACVIAALAVPADAEMVLSQVIVDFLPEEPAHEDIEVWNSGQERMYVAAEPFRIVNPGTPQEDRQAISLEQDDALLVSPRRLVLEPGERRVIRIAAMADRAMTDAVYRVAVRPVAGPIAADTHALKVLVGYDVLVLLRPVEAREGLEVDRRGKALRLRNTGNTAAELFDGRQCAPDGQDCRALPSRRLYPGAQWDLTLPHGTVVTYRVATGGKSHERRF